MSIQSTQLTNTHTAPVIEQSCWEYVTTPIYSIYEWIKDCFIWIGSLFGCCSNSAPPPAITAVSVVAPVTTAPPSDDVLTPADLERARAIVGQLSPEEQTALREFFTRNEWSTDIPYTLMGNKPMVLLFNHASEQGAHQWRALLHCNEISPFATNFKWILRDYSGDETTDLRFYLLNLPLCERIIAQHLRDFQTILESPYSTQEILQILQGPRNSNSDRLYSRILLGMLLGYGRDNCFRFDQAVREGNVIMSLDISAQRLPENDFSPYSIPVFRCLLHSEETRHLLELYTADQRNIVATYHNRDRLEVALALLTKR